MIHACCSLMWKHRRRVRRVCSRETSAVMKSDCFQPAVKHHLQHVSAFYPPSHHEAASSQSSYVLWALCHRVSFASSCPCLLPPRVSGEAATETCPARVIHLCRALNSRSPVTQAQLNKVFCPRVNKVSVCAESSCCVCFISYCTLKHTHSLSAQFSVCSQTSRLPHCFTRHFLSSLEAKLRLSHQRTERLSEPHIFLRTKSVFHNKSLVNKKLSSSY